MFPLIAIGAAVIGTVALTSGNSSGGSSRSADSRSADAQRQVSPQSYIVTPIGGQTGGNPASAMESVRNFIV